MFFFLAHLLTQNADACPPVAHNASLIDSFPVDYAQDVPTDAVIMLEFFDGVPPNDLDAFRLYQDGAEIEVEAQILMTNHEVTGTRAVIEIIPAVDLPVNQAFVLEQDDREILHFTSSDQGSPTVSSVPDIIGAESIFVDNYSYGEINSCQPETQTDIVISIGDDKLSSEHALVLYRVDRNGEMFTEEPFAIRFDPFSPIYIQQPNTREFEEFCFQAAFKNQSAEESALSPIFCAYDYYNFDKCGTRPWSCSSMSADNFAWMSLGLGLVGLMRRRRGRSEAM